MSEVRRIYVEKKAPYAVKSHELAGEIKSYLGITSVNKVRIFVRYDIENVSEETYKKALGTVFSEPPIDILYEENFAVNANDHVFSVEYLPGQFDQRADSAEQCVKLLNESEEPVIRSATTYVLEGTLSEEEFEKIKAYCINPVDSRESSSVKPETLVSTYEEPADVKIMDGFITAGENDLKELYDSLNSLGILDVFDTITFNLYIGSSTSTATSCTAVQGQSYDKWAVSSLNTSSATKATGGAGTTGTVILQSGGRYRISDSKILTNA